VRQLSGQDASFLYTETANTPALGASCNIYDQSTAPGGLVRFKDILARFESRIHLGAYLRSRLVRVPMDLDHPYWIDDPDFDLEFHVRHIALPKPGDWRQLCIQVARLIARPLDLSRPPWELYVIEGLDNVANLPAGSFAIVNKVHHAAVDGVSGVDVLNLMHDLEPDAAPPPKPEKEWTPEPVPTPWELMTRAQFNHATMPMRLAETVGRSFATFAAPGPMAPFGPQLRLPSSSVPRTRFNAPVSAHRVLEGRRLSLDAIRGAKESVAGATVNDVVLTVVGGAIRSYLESKDELPAEPLVTMAPVSIRTEGSMAEGNQVAAMFVPIGTHIADPLERLSAVRNETSEQKLMLEAIDAPQLVAYSQFLPGGLIGASQRLNAEFGLANTRQPVFNTVVTNIPGSQVPLYFAGARLVETWGFGPLTDNAGLFHSVQSYCGAVYLGVTSDPKMLPDPAFYAQCLRESYDGMIEAAAKRRPPARKAAAKKKQPKSVSSARASAS
jgi:diacylglycerol O-acyltransferase / wax synthase